MLLNRVNQAARSTVVTGDFGSPALVVVNRHFPGAAIAARLGPGPSGENADEAAISGINTATATDNFTPVGVMGGARGQGSHGVFGYSDRGTGVSGVITSAEGVAIEGTGPVGVRAIGREVGLEVQGSLVLSQAGVVTIPAGKRFIRVGTNGGPVPPRLRPESFVVACALGAGQAVWVTSTRRLSSESFRIDLNTAAPDGGLTVGFVIIN